MQYKIYRLKDCYELISDQVSDDYMQSFYFLLSLHICLKFSIIKSF